MKLFVLRHGRAESRAASDADRQLTASGGEDVARVVDTCRQDLVGLEQLWASPLVRAQQTADIVLQVLGDSVPRHTSDALVPEAPLSNLYQQLQTRRGSEALMLVSHLPLVGELVNDLCGAEPGYYAMGTSALACIELDLAASGMGDLLWLRQPPF